MNKIFITSLVLAGFLLFFGIAGAQNGERVMQPEYGSGLEGDPDQPIIGGSLPNPDPEDRALPVLTQPSVGGKDAASSTEDTTQRNESDMEFLTRLPSVAVSAVEVRGWDAKEKESFLESVKEYAEVESGQDLENFARGVLLRDENIEEIEIEEDSVVVKRVVPARFLGLFETSIREETRVVFGDGEYGRVKVKFPWYRFMYRVSHDAEDLQERIEETLAEDFSEEGEGYGLPTRAAAFLDALLSE